MQIVSPSESPSSCGFTFLYGKGWWMMMRTKEMLEFVTLQAHRGTRQRNACSCCEPFGREPTSRPGNNVPHSIAPTVWSTLVEFRWRCSVIFYYTLCTGSSFSVLTKYRRIFHLISWYLQNTQLHFKGLRFVQIGSVWVWLRSLEQLSGEVK